MAGQYPFWPTLFNMQTGLREVSNGEATGTATVSGSTAVGRDGSLVRGDQRLSGTGRHLAAVQLRVWTRFLDSSRLLEEKVARHLADEHSISHREYEILVRLDGNDGVMRMSVLADQIVASAPLVTQTVDRLVQRGFVVRQRPGNDSRGSEAVLTKAGSAKLLDVSGAHALLIERFLLDAMDKPTAIMVGDVLSKVSGHLRTHRHGDHCELCATEN